MKPDVVVVGSGTSGLVAALRLAEAGAAVLVLAKGAGSLRLAPGTIDLLGYAAGERVSDPLRAIGELDGLPPGHPYATLGADAVVRSARWLQERVAAGPLAPYAYVGSPEENLLLPTAIGVPRPSALVPETMAAGDLRSGGRLLVAGFRGMKDFHPSLVAENLERTGAGAVHARSVLIEPPSTLVGEAGPLTLAAALERVRGVEDVATRLAGEVRDGETLVLPAVLSVRNPHATWALLGERLECPVCEVPTLPPSVPGIRLFDTLRLLLRDAGGRLVTGPVVVRARASAGRVEFVNARVSGGQRVYGVRWVVLATGGVSAGGLELDADWRMHETALGLHVAGVPEPREPRFSPRYLGEHPLSTAGVAVDERLRPLGPDGAAQYENVLVVGAALAGATPWREKSGEGIALASGFRAAELILEAESGRFARAGGTVASPAIEATA